MRRLKCFFCLRGTVPTRLVDYRTGVTGKKGSYRRRICEACAAAPVHLAQIRGEWKGK